MSTRCVIISGSLNTFQAPTVMPGFINVLSKVVNLFKLFSTLFQTVPERISSALEPISSMLGHISNLSAFHFFQ